MDRVIEMNCGAYRKYLEKERNLIAKQIDMKPFKISDFFITEDIKYMMSKNAIIITGIKHKDDKE